MSSNSSSGGVGCLSVIFIVLLILKLFGVINISWWWVCAPVILEAVIAIAALIYMYHLWKKSKE